jgi:hypothetical protein
MKADTSMLFGLIVGLFVMFMLFGVLTGLISTTRDLATEPLPGIDEKVKFDALIGSAFTLNSYTYGSSMPRDSMGRLNFEAANEIEKARAKSIFKGRAGQLFVEALVETRYLEKHRFECLNGCENLGICTLIGETIYGTDAADLTDKDIEEMLGVSEVVGPCLTVADYLMRRNQYLAKQAQLTSGVLSGTWTETPP